jgi:hypothetical protein
LETLNYIVEKYNEPASIRLLFWTLMGIHIRIKHDNVKHEPLKKALILMKKYKN